MLSEAEWRSSVQGSGARSSFAKASCFDTSKLLEGRIWVPKSVSNHSKIVDGIRLITNDPNLLYLIRNITPDPLDPAVGLLLSDSAGARVDDQKLGQLRSLAVEAQHSDSKDERRAASYILKLIKNARELSVCSSCNEWDPRSKIGYPPSQLTSYGEKYLCPHCLNEATLLARGMLVAQTA